MSERASAGALRSSRAAVHSKAVQPASRTLPLCALERLAVHSARSSASVEGESAMKDGYSPDEVEGLLQSGDTPAAIRAGWFGDEWIYRLVQTAAGGTADHVDVCVDPYGATTDLGLDLSNDDGVAAINAISSIGAVGRDGRLRTGDVITCVNGQRLFTCEAVVRAIKGARGGPLSLSAVRPPPVRVWRDDNLVLAAGALTTFAFEVAAPGACVSFRWQTHAHDVAFHVARLGSKSEGSTSRHQTSLFDQRQAAGSGHVVLAQPGRYVVSVDNTYSIVRSKRLRYLLRLVPLASWEAGRQVERLAQLEAEVSQRKVRSREIAAEIAAADARATELAAELASAQAAAERARVAHEENRRLWREAKAERERLVGLTPSSGGATPGVTPGGGVAASGRRGREARTPGS